MATLARKFVLNPLATCFVPSSFYENNVELLEIVEAASKRLNTDKNPNDFETNGKLDNTLKKSKIENGTESLTEDTNVEKNTMEMSHLPTNGTMILSEKKENEWKLYGMEALALCHLILLVALDFFRKISMHDSKDESCDIPSICEEREEECHCPPMFGWVLPPAFLGNPLKLKYKCSKNQVHTSWYSGKTVYSQSLPVVNTWEEDLWEKSTFKVSKTLQQCSIELEMIIRDVCDTVSVYDSQFDFEENPDVLGSSICELDKSESLWNNATVDKVYNETEIVDDGSHPLLQSADSSTIIDDNMEDSLKDVEKILEKCLSPGKESDLFDFKTKFKPVCSPPCSVWCDNVPKAVKETYFKFVRRSESFESKSMVEERSQLISERPSFKRSLSADDTPQYISCLGWSTATESQKKLKLLRRDPIAYNNWDSMLKDGKRQHRSYSDLYENNLPDNFFTTGLSKRSNSWEPFDAADSLWKPLPDCVPSREDAPKHGSQRKFREVRSQRSMNVLEAKRINAKTNTR